ncbi:SH3 domain-containing protein [Flavimaricola marinus]|uniref:SH3 domain-containing protein n=1 Tax=Flavimaricola marinus TaxID=1819565 RepID=UPI003520DD7E
MTLALLALATAVPAQQIRPEARPVSLVLPDEDILDEPSTNADLTEVSNTPIEPPAPTDVSEQASAEPDPSVGPETNLPLPRFVSLKTDEGNVRRGPSLSHRIDWVFLRRDMPLQVIAEYGHWRRVVDREGLGGWVHYALLSGTRTVIVDDNLLPIRVRPSETAPEAAQLEAGVIARLGECNPDWCRISAGGYRGWALKSALWGVASDEIRD